MESELPHPTNRCTYDGWNPLHKVSVSLPVIQGTTKERPYPNTIHAQCVVDTVACRIGTLFDTHWVTRGGDGDDYQPNVSMVQIFQA